MDTLEYSPLASSTYVGRMAGGILLLTWLTQGQGRRRRAL